MGASASQTSLVGRLPVEVPFARLASGPPVTFRYLPPWMRVFLPPKTAHGMSVLAVARHLRALADVRRDGVVEQAVAVAVALGVEVLQRLRGFAGVEGVDLGEPVARRGVRRIGRCVW